MTLLWFPTELVLKNPGIFLRHELKPNQNGPKTLLLLNLFLRILEILLKASRPILLLHHCRSQYVERWLTYH